jgi:hypothetical protein
MYQAKCPARSQWVDLRHHRYHLHVWGQAQSEQVPLVLLHGWMDVGASFQFMVDALSAERWVIASNDVQFGSGALDGLSKARRDEITLTGRAPHWQAFAIGDQVVNTIGLFDEALHPAYFEDNDYERRAEYAGITVKMVDLEISHDNSSTVKAGFEHRNAQTYQNNNKYYEAKKANKDYGAGSWSLKIRRENSWD